jgi:putative membrane protein
MGETNAIYNDFLPALNAVLNGTAAVFLTLGYLFIKKGNKTAHRNAMILAFLVSSAFLVSYLYYHFNYTARKFPGTGMLKNLYLSMLISHIIGAIVLVPGVVGTLYFAYKKNWIKHTRWTRKVWPLWMYISITGVLIYFSLYGANS